MTLIIQLLFLISGLYFVITGYWFIALVFFVLVIGLEFFFLITAFFVGVVLLMLLTGCGSFVKTEYIYVDNSAVNNYVGNPCAFYLGDRCLLWKDGRLARNPDSPLRSK